MYHLYLPMGLSNRIRRRYGWIYEGEALIIELGVNERWRWWELMKDEKGNGRRFKLSWSWWHLGSNVNEWAARKCIELVWKCKMGGFGKKHGVFVIPRVEKDNLLRDTHKLWPSCRRNNQSFIVWNFLKNKINNNYSLILPNFYLFRPLFLLSLPQEDGIVEEKF